MSKPFDYSKWDNIELSDDEDDVHPNIDRESWFRMKHRSRVEREEREEKDKKKICEEVSVPLYAAIDLRSFSHRYIVYIHKSNFLSAPYSSFMCVISFLINLCQFTDGES